MPIAPGIKIIRLTPSSTGRNVNVGDLGVVGGIHPEMHSNPSEFDGEFSSQWTNGLWSMMEENDKGRTWKYLSPLDDPDAYQEDEEEPILDEETPEEDRLEPLIYNEE